MKRDEQIYTLLMVGTFHILMKVKVFYVLSSCVFCCIYHIYVIHTCDVILLVYLFDHGNYVGEENTSNVMEEVYKDMKIFMHEFYYILMQLLIPF